MNLNGRLYDPLIGRMFSVDPYIADNSNSQAYNSYSYALNNPLKFTDKSGNIPLLALAMIGGFVNFGIQEASGNNRTSEAALQSFGIGAASGFAGGVVGAGVSGAVGYGGAHAGAVIGGSSGFASGFVAGAGTSWANGASFGDGALAGLQAGGIGLVTGGISGGVMGGIRAHRSGLNFWNGQEVSQYIANGIGDGGMVYDQGGGELCPNPGNRGKKICMSSFDELWDNYGHTTYDVNGKAIFHHPSSASYAKNQCAIRLGESMQKSGVNMSSYPKGNLTPEGFPRSAKGLADWLARNHKWPKIISQTKFESMYWGQKGIIFIRADQGMHHIDLFKGGKTGSGYYSGDEIWFWKMK